MQAMTYTEWTKKETDFLIENYPKFGRQYCANALNRSLQSTMNKAQRLNLYGGGRKRWEKEDIEYLIKSYPDPNISKADMIKRLDRTWVTIGTMARNRGLRLPFYKTTLEPRVYQKRIRERLEKERGKKCEYLDCKWTETIELHHMDRNRANNNPNNLQLLCPNHHSIQNKFHIAQMQKLRVRFR